MPEALPDFINLWDFGNPAATEEKFREILLRADIDSDISYLAQLLTQIARAQGLKGKFDAAHSTLDRVEKMLTPELTLARMRYLLERGRVFNSSNHQDKAIPFFMQAYTLGTLIGEMKLAIDAVHMLAIVKQDPKEQVEWNLKGIELAKSDPHSSSWLHALYNNIGESYLLLKDYTNARFYFHSLADLQREKNNVADIYTIKDEAKAIRLSGKPNEALVLIEPVLKKLLDTKEDNGWIREEMAESLYAAGEMEKARSHFIKAYQLLSEDEYCINNEKEKLKHLKVMAQ